MKLKLLEQYIKALLENETNASEEMPFGNHLFGEYREKNEPDTDIEKRIYSMLADWVIENDDKETELVTTIFELEKLLKDGKYEDVLRPKAGNVYRGIRMSFEEALSMFGHEMNEFNLKIPCKIFSLKHSYSSRRQPISSWSYDLHMARNFATPESQNKSHVGKRDTVSVIMKATVPQSGDFILNYNEIPVMSDTSEFDEKEVIGVGNINVNSFLVFPFSKLVNQELAQIKNRSPHKRQGSYYEFAEASSITYDLFNSILNKSGF